MSETQLTDERQDAQWQSALLAARLLSVDPHKLGGVWVHGGAGPVRDRWSEQVAGLMPEHPPRRIAPGTSQEALLGGIDLTASLTLSQRVERPGLLAGPAALITLPLGERTPVDLAAKIARVLERGPGHAVLAYDGSTADEAGLPIVLAQRLAFWISLDGLSYRICRNPASGPIFGLAPSTLLSPATSPVQSPLLPPDLASASTCRRIADARVRLPTVHTPPDIITTLTALSGDLGIAGFHAPLLALAAARAAAALEGAEEVSEAHCQMAASLVLGPRAFLSTLADGVESEAAMPSKSAPQGGDQDDEAASTPPRSQSKSESESQARSEPESGANSGARSGPEPGAQSGAQSGASKDPLGDASSAREIMLDAVQAALPMALLDRLKAQGSVRSAERAGSGHRRQDAARGRPLPPRRGKPDATSRLDLLETLKAAVPWQPIRRAERGDRPAAGRLLFRGSDLRVRRCQQRGERLILFVVDASGSAAMARLSEAKGAVELLLADAYARRDSVALIAFRGARADLILAPTRSLVRAKRTLAGLPGGGATPLATGLKLAHETALGLQARGAQPALIVMTDARGNVALSGEMDRSAAQDDTEKLARLVVHAKIPSIVIDTSTRRSPAAENLARQLHADYVALPRSDAKSLSQSIQSRLPSAA